MSTAVNEQMIRSAPLPRVDFEVIVVFTHPRATLAALKTAGSLANGLAARIRVVVPQIVPDLGVRPAGTASLEQRFRTIVGESRVETRVDIRLCRNRWQMLQHVLAPGSIVVLGGPHRRWPTEESRLAGKLRAAGHHVVFVLDEEQ